MQSVKQKLLEDIDKVQAQPGYLGAKGIKDLTKLKV